MRGILSVERYNHWLLFVGAMHILLSSSISPTDLELAEDNLNLFYFFFEQLYGSFPFFKKIQKLLFIFFKKEIITIIILLGRRWCSINIHHMKHFIFLVKEYGPLWTVSCFPYESMNSTLRKLVHGTNSVLHQVLIDFFSPLFFFEWCFFSSSSTFE